MLSMHNPIGGSRCARPSEATVPIVKPVRSDARARAAGYSDRTPRQGARSASEMQPCWLDNRPNFEPRARRGSKLYLRRFNVLKMSDPDSKLSESKGWLAVAQRKIG